MDPNINKIRIKREGKSTKEMKESSINKYIKKRIDEGRQKRKGKKKKIVHLYLIGGMAPHVLGV
jgi:hypothetical protein